MRRADGDHLRSARALPHSPRQGEKVEIVTPEGIPLRFTIATFGDRVNAFALDALIIVGTILILAFLALAAFRAGAFGSSGLGSWVGVFLQLAFFLGANFYFTWFETRGQGRTPGKRAIGIRVIDAAGGPLTADAVIARNLMRQLEVLIPIGLISNPEILWPDTNGWVRALAFIWIIAFALMPLWNKHRMRIGDLVAGTMVVIAPRAVLLGDIGARPSVATAAASGPTYTFTAEQLDIYGIYELQVLEDLLRAHDEEKPTGSLRDRLREDQDQDRLGSVGVECRRVAFPHRLLCGPARAPRAQDALWQEEGGQARAVGGSSA